MHPARCREQAAGHGRELAVWRTEDVDGEVELDSHISFGVSRRTGPLWPAHCSPRPSDPGYRQKLVGVVFPDGSSQMG